MNESSTVGEPTYEKDENGFMILPEDYFGQDHPSPNVYSPAPAEGKALHPRVKAFCEGHEVASYVVKTNLNNVFDPEGAHRKDDAFATIFLRGEATLQLQLNFNTSRRIEVYPEARNAETRFEESARVLSVAIRETGAYVIELFGGFTFHLFVEDLDAIPTATDRMIVFEPGVHNASNDPRIRPDHYLHLRSGDVVYLMPGAFLEGGVQATGAKDITVTGHGYFDGSVFKRSATTGERMIPIDFNFCQNIDLSHFSVIDPAGWAFNLYFDEGVRVNNCKIISSRPNGDGISVQSGKDVDVSDCFVRTWDDSLVVKNYPKYSDKNQEGRTERVSFRRCLVYTDLAQSMEIGYETVGEVMEDILFEDITVIRNRHLAVLSIHNANNAHLRRVTFRNITVDRAECEGGKILDFTCAYSPTWSEGHKVTGLGSIAGVTVENVLVREGRANLIMNIKGSVESRPSYPREEHRIADVSITDFSLMGSVIDDAYPYLEQAFTDHLSFAKTGKPVSGARFLHGETAMN